MLRGRGVRLAYGLSFKSALPWAAFYVLDDFHLQPGVKGAFAYAPHRIDSRKPLGTARAYIDYSAIKDVTTKERDVLIDGTVFVKAVSVKAAERMRRDLDAIRKLPENKRREHIEKAVVEQLDPEKASKIRKADDTTLGTLRTQATIQALVVIGVVTALVLGRIDFWKSYMLVLIFVMMISVVRFVSAHAKVWPKDTASRWARATTFMLSPVGAIKSSDVITHDRMADLHVLAAVRAFMTPTDAAKLVRRALDEAKHPGKETWIDPDPSAKEAQLELRCALAKALETIAPPAASKAAANDGIVVRCPRCGAGYVKIVSECFDCGAVVPKPD